MAPAVEDHTEATAVRDAVLRLHAAHRELVMLIHWDGFTVTEAAELLGLNASTARSRYSAAAAGGVAQLSSRALTAAGGRRRWRARTRTR
ncbi:sigma factor-like helix-turn-helix DNA-binding protein [Nocardioides jishulii]|uniref:sigma factor-like helix-turn-helix DNA-binding protein n=1 Tax=Nocardioides jishulii TaxID=2575440 RepID=UPI0023B32761|nr:sigma factor-like helix-turn-helix DNA-binding protein [Nocardioides jishulii]